MTDIIWYSTEENVNWGEWREVERLPLGHRLRRWWDKIRGYRYVVGGSWPRRWVRPLDYPESAPLPLIAGSFGPVAQAQQYVIATLRRQGALEGEIIIVAVSRLYDDAKSGVIRYVDRIKPRYEISSARPCDGGFEAIYTPVDYD